MNSFSEAFKKARKEKGAGGTFTFNGKSYSTNYKDEKPQATSKRPPSKTGYKTEKTSSSKSAPSASLRPPSKKSNTVKTTDKPEVKQAGRSKGAGGPTSTGDKMMAGVSRKIAKAIQDSKPSSPEKKMVTEPKNSLLSKFKAAIGASNPPAQSSSRRNGRK